MNERIFEMTLTPQTDGVEYEVKDPGKDFDVPVLVSIDAVKLEKPVQIIGRHIDDPDRKNYTGSPSSKKISDNAAKELVKDAMEANPGLKDRLESILYKYFG
jgi:hypothetical protein